MSDIHSEKILILDFGSQYTQLIARRVREAHVYCELHPFDMDLQAIRDFATRGHHPLRGAQVGLRGGAPAVDGGALRTGHAGAGDLLRHAADEPPLRRRVVPAGKREFGHAELRPRERPVPCSKVFSSKEKVRSG